MAVKSPQNAEIRSEEVPRHRSLLWDLKEIATQAAAGGRTDCCLKRRVSLPATLRVIVEFVVRIQPREYKFASISLTKRMEGTTPCGGQHGNRRVYLSLNS